MSSRRRYGPCHACGGRVEERVLDQPFVLRGRLHLVRAVPLGVCRDCGERVADAKVVRRIEAALARPGRRRKTVRVPVVEYGALVDPRG